MEKKEFLVKLYSGLFFVIGIILILAVILSIGMDKGIMQAKFTVKVLFREVGGLSIGAPIRLSGVTVGSVRKIDFLPQEVNGRNVEVTLSFFKRYRAQIEKAYSFRIATEGVLGQKIVNISTDRTGQNRTKSLDSAILGEDPLNVQDLAETFGEAVASFQGAAGSLDDLMVDVQVKFQAIKRVFNRLEQRLIDGTLFRVF
ncbi:MAG: MlaD family protein [Candidatus Aceula meridiana]|nr:MlaD family protein [Candidatus Aceula meridiana]